MNTPILEMLKRYDCKNAIDFENALVEIMQEIALLGLWRSKFFEHAAFYGGTALRIVYGLNRFSQDLDFSLLQTRNDFSLSPYLSAVQAELNSFGFGVEIEEKNKSFETRIDSAFIKAGTREHLIKIDAPSEISGRLHRNRSTKIKLEIDTDPPPHFQTEAKSLLEPAPFSVLTYTLPNLFAGKLHAILQRDWKNRIKGRDYYDFIWYIGRKVPANLTHLEARLRQSGGWTKDYPMQKSDLLDMLNAKFANLDIELAKKDVLDFIRDPMSLDLWSNEFFQSLLPSLKIEP
jgi:predicted nucleotidyltransferase component of viral defense system